MIETLGPDTALAPLIRQLRTERDPVVVVPAAPAKAEALAAFAEALTFPEWFGHNLDALYDCLLAWVHEHRNAALIWDGVAGLKEANPEDYQRIRHVLADVLQELPSAHITIIERV